MFKYLVLTSIFSSLIFGQNPENNSFNLMPYPAKITAGNGFYIIDTSFTIEISNFSNNRLEKYSSRILRRISGKTGMFFKQDYVSAKNKVENPALKIAVKREGLLKDYEDESYRLKITNNSITIESETDLGALRGLETLFQLIVSDASGNKFPVIDIEDEPRFTWRGLMIDVCRHFMPLEMILRNIDAMAMVKLNVLHLHLSEDQGWRIESKIFPKLQELGSDGLYFTQEEIKYIVNYAGDRGIRVVPEIDIPGHSSALLTAYPELGSGPGPYKIDRTWGIKTPTLNPTTEKTYEFLDKLFGELTPLFPDAYFHIGGDEVKDTEWKNNPEINEYMKANGISDYQELQAYFNGRVLNILQKYGKTLVGWDEILHDNMPKNSVIHSWRGIKALMKAVREGYKAILSNGYYIDLNQSTVFHYKNDPLPEGNDLTDEEKKRVLGGEATMWAELVTNENVDSRIWPRTAAIAERLWSPQSISDVRNMYKRLGKISLLLEETGVKHIKNYDMMLRRLMSSHEVSTLKVLVDVVQPLQEYARHRTGPKLTSFSPYTRIVDIATADPEFARGFNFLCEDYNNSKNKELIPLINNYLNLWRDNHALFLQISENIPVIQDGRTHSLNLKRLAENGLELTIMIEKGEKVSSEKIKSIEQLIELSKKESAQCELAVITGFEFLLNSVKK